MDGDDPAPSGFYTLAATSIALAALPEALLKRLPRYPLVPAVLMGRLAVDARHRGCGLGQLLLMDAFSRSLRSEIAAYTFIVDAKSEAAASFHAAHAFRTLSAEGRRLFIPMAEVARLFA